MFESGLRLRIPPSPTGSLHLGTARTALYNWLLAKRFKGVFVFRLEDTDRERSKSEFVTDIIEGFKWLGIDWNEGPLRQSEHKARHQMVVNQLLDKNLAYECFCSSEELEQIRIAQRALNKVEGYDNRHRNLSKEQKEAFRAEGRKPVIRFKLPNKAEIAWTDLVRGKMSVNASDLGGDPVIAKENGDVLYNFAVVVDDHDSAINCVIRGEDHLHNTAKQIPIYEAMEWEIPKFAHVPLILTANREKLSKRKHGDIASISNYIKAGYLPEAINNYLIAMSWQFPSDDNKEVFTKEEAFQYFDLKDLSKSAAIYDPLKLNWFCKEHFQRLSAEEVLARAKAGGFLELLNNLEEYSKEEQLQIISLMKDGLIKLSDLSNPASATSLLVFCQAPNLQDLNQEAKNCLQEPEAKLVLSELNNLLETSPDFSPEIVQKLLINLAEKTGLKKGKKLFWPIRVAVSGNVHGADLVSLLNILNKNKLQERVKATLQYLEI
jgi:glutamyl-tRNA synthetase